VSQSKVCIALVSGGIDSPVAVARMLNQGWTIHCLHFSQEEVTGPQAEEKTIALMRHLLTKDGEIGELARRNLNKKLTIVPIAKQLSKFTEQWAHTEYFIHMKRLFHRIGGIIGKEIGATHILTGENLGQVSSQTLGNMGAIEEMAPLIPLRPLLAFDKRYIIDMARKLETYRISVGVEVCDALGPDHPTTVANKEWLEKSEMRVGGIEALCNDALGKRYQIAL
jgi:thiamine biosynthesis protein ThiI